MPEDFAVVFALDPGVTQLDVTGPHDVCARLPRARDLLASLTGGNLEAGDGIVFGDVRRLADNERCARGGTACLKRAAYPRSARLRP